jgi:hypothetical protein
MQKDTPQNIPKNTTIILFVLFFLNFFSFACTVKPIHHVPQPLESNIDGVRAVIETGDWVIIRGITGPDNFIGTVTNMPFSHASIYDAENDEVIEADSHGVHKTSLEDYIGHAARVWVVKPVWATDEIRPLVVRKARSLVGRPYDFTGLIGLGLDDSYYCSELVMDVWKPYIGDADTNPIPLVISPGRLHHWGKVVYDSMVIGLGVIPKTK